MFLSRYILLNMFSMISMQAISFKLTRHTENYFHMQTYPDRQTDRQTDTYTHVWKRSALRSEFDNYLPNVLPIYNNHPPFLYLPPFPSYFFSYFPQYMNAWAYLECFYPSTQVLQLLYFISKIILFSNISSQ